MFPEPYISKESWYELRRDIEANGVEEDPILQVTPECPVFGLNLAFGWPLPSVLRNAYERTAGVLAGLDPGIYVYPYYQTHVTVMTLLNFKYHQNPTDDEVQGFLQLVPLIVARVAPFVSSLEPFTITVGPPVLSRRAGFLPILNRTGEIVALRKAVEAAIQPLALTECSVPQAIHSTVARFLRQPADTQALLSSFELAASDLDLGQATVTELLLTSETKPYMRDGEILFRFKLGTRL